jgi:hypothetical protein
MSSTGRRPSVLISMSPWRSILLICACPTPSLAASSICVRPVARRIAARSIITRYYLNRILLSRNTTVGPLRHPAPLPRIQAKRREHGSIAGSPGPRFPRRISGSYPQGRPAWRPTGSQVVRVGRVHQDLLVLVATTPLPRPVQSVTRPPEQVVCPGDPVRAVVIVGMRDMGHCPSLTRASAAEGSCPHRLVLAASSSEPPASVGLACPSSRSLATASREAIGTIREITDTAMAATIELVLAYPQGTLTGRILCGKSCPSTNWLGSFDSRAAARASLA